MRTQGQEQLEIRQMRLRRFKSQKKLYLESQLLSMGNFGSELRLKSRSVARSRSKSKLVEKRLFASAKKVDNRLTMLTKSSLSEQSAKTPIRISGLARSSSKQSLLSSKRLSINMVVSQVVPPCQKQANHDLSLLIDKNTVKVLNGSLKMDFGESQISDRQESVLQLYSEIQEMDESIENERR